MPGPPPKPPGLRQRRNRPQAGATVLPAAAPSKAAPKLPNRGCTACGGDGELEGAACAYCEGSGVQPWHPLVVERWASIWSSPMASQFLGADVHGLYVLADLWDLYWRGDKSLTAEIRLQEQRFGLSSLDRRRLQWEVERPAAAPGRRAGAPLPKRLVKDPRSFLKAVK